MHSQLHLKQTMFPVCLLQSTHAGLPLGTRSYLGAALPESLLFALETQGPEAFADALSGERLACSVGGAKKRN